MPWLRTDDGPRKLRAVWLGPSGSTLPFQWTYVQWAVTLCVIPVGIGLLWLIMAAVGIPFSWIWPFAIPWGGTFAVYLAVKVMSRVTFDEPLRYHQRLVRAEWSSQSSRRHRDHPLELRWARPKIGYLSESTLRAMGWAEPGQRPVPVEPTDSSAPAEPRQDLGVTVLEPPRTAAPPGAPRARPWWQQEEYLSPGG
jgi:hypothetical protein